MVRMRLVLLLGAVSITIGCREASTCQIAGLEQHFDTPVHLDGPLAVDEIERRHLVGEKQLPFGRIHDQWIRLKASVRSGDCLFSFETDEESWKQLSGRKGYILVRDGVPIDGIVYMLN